MSSAHGPLPGRPAERYGDPGPVRRRVRLGVLVGLGAALAVWAVWAGAGLASGRVDVQEQSYQVVDDATVVVVFNVTKGAEEVVRCRVEALSSTSAVVGLEVVEVGADAGASSTQTVTVRTQQRAVTGVVGGCGAA